MISSGFPVCGFKPAGYPCHLLLDVFKPALDFCLEFLVLVFLRPDVLEGVLEGTKAGTLIPEADFNKTGGKMLLDLGAVQFPLEPLF